MTLRYDYGMIVEYSEYTERVNVMTECSTGRKPGNILGIKCCELLVQ